MLKFITALLFAQVLLAAPMPWNQDDTDNWNDIWGRTKHKLKTAGEYMYHNGVIQDMEPMIG